MKQSPSSAEEVWAATQSHPRLFNEAAHQIGLTPAEYKEFRTSLLDGKAVYVRLPRRFTAMAGDRNGSIYAVHHAILPINSIVYGWKVKLHDGSEVFVPQTCGNLSLVRRPATVVVHTIPRKTVVYHAPPAPPEIPVAIDTTPAVVTPVAPPAAVVAAKPNYTGLLAIPVIGAIIIGLQHNSPAPPPVIPPCSQGSNAIWACQK